MKSCEYCGAEFEYIRSSKRFCSKKCVRQKWYDKNTPRPYKNPVPAICSVCGAEYLKIRDNHIYCSKQCRNAYHNHKHLYTRKPLTSAEERTRAYAAAESRRKNMMKEVPDKMILTIHEIIGRRLKNPAQLISVQGVFKLMLKKTDTPKDGNQILNEALYYYIYKKLEEAGGTLTEFQTTSGTGRRWIHAPMRAIFRFPPLQERTI